MKKDEEYMFDLESIRITVGVDVCVLEEGKIVERHVGTS